MTHLGWLFKPQKASGRQKSIVRHQRFGKSNLLPVTFFNVALTITRERLKNLVSVHLGAVRPLLLSEAC
jgi:hypothetical protein